MNTAPRTPPESRNRALVRDAVTGKALTVTEIATQTGLGNWVVIACIWLEAATGNLTSVRDPDNPLEVRWRRDE